ncbi:hypothetical protein K461DRAFT_5309 [Myriangium duriaei CBS 260.36]|uniref:Uncharacterized protein n=1 Tax=Myriangium duriaei CBS 260.36 TaxID=1168546 RepID=A0A9P4JD65_9PEZI|nr:hypothetical protein K461DRAFT_5309 [Myriangium duriaei CBS 260.36]
MTEVASRPSAATTGSRVQADLPGAPPPPSVAPSKKTKGKKVVNDQNEANRQLQARIAQLEQDKAGKTEEDAEIDREVRKANREMQSMLTTMDNVNNRADYIHKKWTELLGELKRTEREHSRAKKRADQLQKEKDSQRSELTKANSVKDKLEKLSRELTKENKRLKDDLRDIKETAEDKNEELHRRLEQMVGDVEDVILSRESPNRVVAELDEDKMFKEKFKSFVEQYEMREIHMASVLRARELEIQYHIAQHDKLRKAQDAELTKSHQLTRQVSTFSQTENELRNQLNIYVEKFKQEATNKNIFQMAEERSHSQKEIDRLAKENDKLKKLCRAMQTNGYGRVGGGAVEGAAVDPQHPQSAMEPEPEEESLGETDSEYEYRDDGDDYDDESTEEDPATPPMRTYGPVPPPPPPPATTDKFPNGVNGVRH